MVRAGILAITAGIATASVAVGGILWLLRARGSVLGSTQKWYTSLKKIKLANKKGVTVYLTPVRRACICMTHIVHAIPTLPLSTPCCTRWVCTMRGSSPCRATDMATYMPLLCPNRMDDALVMVKDVCTCSFCIPCIMFPGPEPRSRCCHQS